MTDPNARGHALVLATPPMQHTRQLPLTGPTGQRVRVQRSMNLHDWEDWQTVTLDGTSLELTQVPQRFYRGVEND